MKLEPIYKKTKTGLEVELRSATENDAEAMVEYLKKVCGETPFLLSYPEEIKYTAEGEKEFLKNYEKNKKALMLNAFVDGKLAGNASFDSVSDAMRLSHRASLGVAVYKEYWHQGIGELLTQTLIEKARECGYEILELDVVADNEGAISLYRKLGFEECGRSRCAVKYKDGTYSDELLMQLFL